MLAGVTFTTQTPPGHAHCPAAHSSPLPQTVPLATLEVTHLCFSQEIVWQGFRDAAQVLPLVSHSYFFSCRFLRARRFCFLFLSAEESVLSARVKPEAPSTATRPRTTARREEAPALVRASWSNS